MLGPATEPESDEGFGLVLAGLDRPHFTETVVPSTSTPEAHASAARSAYCRSTKFTNAQRFFATCTMDLKELAGMAGSDATRAVLSDCSVADSGREVRNSDVMLASSGG